MVAMLVVLLVILTRECRVCPGWGTGRSRGSMSTIPPWWLGIGPLVQWSIPTCNQANTSSHAAHPSVQWMLCYVMAIKSRHDAPPWPPLHNGQCPPHQPHPRASWVSSGQILDCPPASTVSTPPHHLCSHNPCLLPPHHIMDPFLTLSPSYY